MRPVAQRIASAWVVAMSAVICERGQRQQARHFKCNIWGGCIVIGEVHREVGYG
jgi:hypothetical protein